MRPRLLLVTTITASIVLMFVVSVWGTVFLSPTDGASMSSSVVPLQAPEASPGPGQVNSTLCLVSNTLLVGNQPNACGDGIGPSVAAFDSSNGNIYVSDFESGSTINGEVSVISGSSHTLVANIPLSGTAAGMAFDPNNGNLYVAHGGALSVISGTNNSVTANVPVGSNPVGVTYDPSNGDLYVTNPEQDTVSVISSANNALVTTITVGSFPNGAVFDPLDADVYVTNSGSNFISVISSRNNLIVATVAVGATSGTFDSIDGDLYFANTTSDQVNVISGSNDTALETIPINGLPSHATNALAFDPNNGDLYVVLSSNFVNVISGTNNSMVASVPVGINPSCVAADSTNGEVYVTNYGANTVGVVSGSNNTMFTTILTGSMPFAPVYDPINDTIYVTDTVDDNVSVVSGSTNRKIGDISVGGDPRGAAYDSINGNLYVSNQIGTVSVISTSTGRVVSTFYPGGAAIGATFDPTNGDVYILVQSSAVDVVNGSTNAIVATVPLGSYGAGWGAAFDPMGDDVYVAQGCNFYTATCSSNVSVVSGSTNRLVANVTVGTEPSGMAYDPANGAIYVADEGANNVSVISTISNLVTATIPAGSGPDGVAYDPANGDLYVTDLGTNNVTVISGATNTVVAILPVGISPTNIVYDPGNEQVYVADYGSAALTVIGPGAGPSPLTITSFTASPPTIPIGGTTYLNVSAAGGTPPYGYTYSGLPAGCNSASQASLPCSPTVLGNFTVTATMTDALGSRVSSAPLTLIVTNSTTSGPVLASVLLKANLSSIAVGGTASFSAEPACDGGLCPPEVIYLWRLSPATIGDLNSTTGSTVSFTAGSSPGTAVVSVEATFQGVHKWANASITITSGTPHSPPVTTTFPPGISPWEFIGGIGFLIAIAAIVVWTIHRKKAPR